MIHAQIFSQGSYTHTERERETCVLPKDLSPNPSNSNTILRHLNTRSTPLKLIYIISSIYKQKIKCFEYFLPVIKQGKNGWPIYITNPLLIENPLYIDKATTFFGKLAYARCYVEVNASEPLVKQVKNEAEGEKPLEWLPPTCSKCKSFGHEQNQCPTVGIWKEKE